MRPEKKKSSSRCVRYPVLVLFTGMAIAVIVPVLWKEVNARAFGHLMGSMTFPVFLIAIFVGLISDRNHKKKMEQDLG